MNANSSCVNTPPPGSDGPRKVVAPSDDAAAQSPGSDAPPPSIPGDRAPASRPAPYRCAARCGRPRPRAATSPSSSRSEAALRASKEALHNLAPGLTSKLNLAADCLLVVASAAFSSAGRSTLQHSAWVTLIALGVWIVGARVLRHYDAWSEGLFGELAVTSVLVVSVGVSLQIFNQVSLGHALHAGVGTFLLLTWPGVWFVRATVVAFRAWRHAPPEHVLIIGTGRWARDG